MKQFFFLTLCVAVLQGFSGSARAQDNVIDEVIWVIGDDAILKSDVEKERIQALSYGQRIEGDPYCVIPEQLAIQKLFLHQAKLDSIDVPESQVYQAAEAYVNNMIASVGSREKLEEYEKKPINVIRENIRTLYREREIVREMQKKIVGKVKVSPVDVRRFYDRIPKDSLPFISTTVEVQIITVEPRIALSEIDEIKARLRDFTDQVNKGEREFSTLARIYSEDKETARYGGERGFEGKGTLVPEYAAVAFDLNDPKKVSRIVETEYGYHIIQLVEKRGDRINTRHILLKPKVSETELNEAMAKMDSIRTDIANGKFTFEEGASFLSYDKDSRNNNGLMVNKKELNDPTVNERTGTSRFEMSELPDAMGKVVDKMKVGEISAPFTMINSKQKEIVAIVKLKTRVEGHKASLTDDYQALKGMVENQKSEEILNKWISQKQKDTYIRIHDNWKNCDFERDGWVKE